MTRWFRFYQEALDDPKVQRLDPFDFKCWVNMLCLACRNEGKLPPVADISFALRLSVNDCQTVLERLSNGGLIDRASGGPNGMHHAIHNWEKRQYKSDTSTPRVKRFRERSETVTVTAPETDTDTECKVPLDRGRTRRGTRLPEDWVPKQDLEFTVELEKFRDWARSAPGQKGVKADWDATWRNWMRRVREQGNVTAFTPKAKERDLRNVPDHVLSADDFWRKKRQIKEGVR
jgi:hypothetical protein